jgi:glutathione synthase/RimK-type ligase-like ATP-grasp enzyme
MSSHIIIIEKKSDWKNHYPAAQVITAQEYLAQANFLALKNAKVINLCRSYRYLSEGYYCSLLAEARHHKVLPAVRTLSDLSKKSIYSLDTDNLDELLQKSIGKSEQTEMVLTIFFGQCEVAALKKLAGQIFATFACPLLKVEFKKGQNKWLIHAIKIVTLSTLTEAQQSTFIDALNKYTLQKNTTKRTKYNYRYDLAILHNPRETFSPSNPAALDKFISIGRKLNLDVDLITKKDYTRLAEYDALFIRETTSIDHYTYRFAKKAETEGMVVIDDPYSILRCTNKVYLAELLRSLDIATPFSSILLKDNFNVEAIEQKIPYPIVLKIPDGSFSRGVFKANNSAELAQITTKLFADSDIILAQEYVYTEFDWRIGILNHEPIYACQYFMSDEHWQVVNHNDAVEGGFKTFAVDKIPKKIVRTALKAAKPIGNGLYGVDLKETERGIMVIEVNDNPSIDDGIENAVLGDELYRMILKEFIRRLKKLKN